MNKAKKSTILYNSTPEVNCLIYSNEILNTLPKLDRIHFCRLLGSLGFYEEASECLPVCDWNMDWDFEDEYAFCTKLFFNHVCQKPTNKFSFSDLDFGFSKLSTNPESLRMRLNLAMLGAVSYGNIKNTIMVKKWREQGFLVLDLIQNCNLFDDFEKQLLTSRFYRAVSFYPYLAGNKEMLREDANLCENLARSLITLANDQKQHFLYKENLFPMLESKSRIYQYLGEFEHAIELMEEIVYKIDPFDSKAWIQVGELREQNGWLEGAQEAFQNAGQLGVPLGGISWYRSGRTLEKLGNLELAKDHYMKSLKHNPRGISPLKRIHDISKNTGDNVLENWCLKNLSSLKNRFPDRITS